MADEECSARGVKVEEIIKTSSYFTSLIELIPPKSYVSEDKSENGFVKGKKKKLNKNDKKLLAKKAKMLRLDPAQHKTVNDLQKEIEKKEREKMEEEALNEHIKPIKVSEVTSVPLDELREKLHAKLDKIRGKRKMVSQEEKQNIKKSRVESKTKDKKKKDSDKLSSNIKNATDIEQKSDKSQHTIKNNDGDLVFSKFDFATGSSNKNTKKKSIDKLLKKAEKSKDKIEKLEQQDSDKAQKLKEEIAWNKALKKAEGEKLRDDPKLLKKTIKAKDKQKVHSQKKWQDRMETVEKQKKEKQTKRTENIKERRQDKINRKINKGKKEKPKKKKSKPGF
ncbi:uncharacterized protein [Clytia hemisphaerica]|uniref:uncharacterized protein n=1 Tax=Clytia hemisphaerica TaxID=252671 RepID=UPI0034D465E3